MRLEKKTLGLAVGGFVLAALLAACAAETRQKILSTFFDGVDNPPPPTQRLRRDYGREIEDLRREMEATRRELAEVKEATKGIKPGAQSDKPALPIEQAKGWDEAAKFLPLTDGAVDWVKALASGVIAPRPGVDPNAAEQPVLPVTVEREPAGQAMFKAVFPHEPHTRVIGCDSCHPALFQMQKGATPISMELINSGKTCGACHGKVAFGATACGRCHPALGGGK